MSVQSTARFIDEQADEVYRAIWQLCDENSFHCGETASAVAFAAMRAARAELIRQFGTDELGELYNQRGRGWPEVYSEAMAQVAAA